MTTSTDGPSPIDSFTSHLHFPHCFPAFSTSCSLHQLIYRPISSLSHSNNFLEQVVRGSSTFSFQWTDFQKAFFMIQYSGKVSQWTTANIKFDMARSDAKYKKSVGCCPPPLIHPLDYETMQSYFTVHFGMG